MAGFHAPDNHMFTFNQLLQEGHDIIALQETHCGNNDLKLWERNGWAYLTGMISDLINEYRTHHHCIHAPTPPDNEHSGIILLENKQYDVLHSEIKMPGCMLKCTFGTRVTKHVYNLTVYYAAQVKHLTKPQMVNIVKNFSQVHDISQNNIIIGDFNFADVDMDKGKGISERDTDAFSVGGVYIRNGHG